jgi:hypothetical protein
MTPEGKVKAAIKAWLKKQDVWYYMPVQNGMGMMGIPDFIICWQGRFFAVECKAPGKRATVTPLQERNIRGIQASGGVAVVVTSLEEFLSSIPL